MRILAVVLILLVIRKVPAATQSPAFEVTSVKANRTATNPNRWRVGADATPSGCCSRFVATNATVKMLLTYAYPDRLESEIVGGPDWIKTLRLDVEGRPAPGNTPAPIQQIQLMLRALLQDRFGLKSHTEYGVKSSIKLDSRAHTTSSWRGQLECLQGSISLASQQQTSRPRKANSGGWIS